MPRPHRLTPRVNTVIASAADVTNSRSKRPLAGPHMAWQEEAWEMFDTVGEYEYGVSWKAAACSRATLTITETTPDGEEQIDTGPEVDALEILAGGPDQHSGMLSSIELHGEVSGETWLIGEQADNTGDTQGTDRWTLFSEQEVTVQGGNGMPWTVDEGDGPRIIQDDQATVLRLWHPHPKRKVYANSPSRAALPALRVLQGFAKAQAATLESRLAGNGVFLVPAEAQVDREPWMTEDYGPHIDPMMALLLRAMTTAIQNPGTAAAAAPVIVKIPGAVLDKAKHITFSTPFDERTEKLLDMYLRRVALSLNAPPEILLGLADTNHWNAWQIDESAVKTHIEPDLEWATTGLTEAWLAPAVKALGGVVNPRRRINYDISDLKITPDQSDDAILLYDRVELSGAALRRSTNFEESDAPDAAEVAEIIRRKQATSGSGMAAPPGGTSPQLPAPAAVEKSAPPLPTAAAAGIVAACELLIGRAVERANNRVNQRGRRRPIPTDRLDAALAGAWEQVPRTAQLLGVDCQALTDALDTYTRGVLTEGVDPVQPRALQAVLTEQRVLARAG